MIFWKQGVLCRGEFAQYAIRQEAAHAGWWPFSYCILRELERDFSPEDEPLLERLYQSLAAGTGICKITRRGRFTAFDKELAIRVRSAFSDASPLTVHDMGASSAITSLELYQQLSAVLPVEMIASDYYDQLSLVEFNNGRWTVAFDSHGEPIQVAGCGTVFSQRPFSWRYILNRIVQWYVNRRVIPRSRSILAQAGEGSIHPVALFHPLAVALAQRDSGFRLQRHDLFRPFSTPSHVVRAMNVVTPLHFSSEQTILAIRACAESVTHGGWLILGRSVDEEDGRLRATVYQVEGAGLAPVWSHNEGYEWPELVATANQRSLAGERS